MPQPRLTRKRSLPTLRTLMMGVAALFATDTQASTSEAKLTETLDTVPNSGRPNIGQVAVRTDGQKIYLSDDGTNFEELTIGHTVDGTRIKSLLRQLNVWMEPVIVPVRRVIFAYGGADA